MATVNSSSACNSKGRFLVVYILVPGTRLVVRFKAV